MAKWPNIFRTKDKQYWVVDGRRYENGQRTGKREYFNTEKEAQGRAEELRGVPRVAQALATQAEEILKPYGKTIHEAVAFYVEHLKKQKEANVLLPDAIAQWYAGKEKLFNAGKYTRESLKAARNRSNLLKEHFADKYVNEITPDLFKEWLLPSKYKPTTMSGIKSIASEFFNWAVEKKLAQHNPCLNVRIRHYDKAEVEILTVDQCKALIEAADSCAVRCQALPYTLLGLFCGLRPVEATELKWEDINFETKEIRVVSYEVRYVPMNPDLCDALKRIKEDADYASGRIIQENWKKNWEAVRLVAGFNGDKWVYPADCLRHSFASYWLALHNDRAKLAELMGNSPKVIKQHYRRAIPIADAIEFWGIISEVPSVA